MATGTALSNNNIGWISLLELIMMFVLLRIIVHIVLDFMLHRLQHLLQILLLLAWKSLNPNITLNGCALSGGTTGTFSPAIPI